MTMSSSDVKRELELFELGKGRRVSWGSLRNLLPDVEVALFFAKAYELNYRQLSELLTRLFEIDVLGVLMEGGHSTELQDYLVETTPEDVYPEKVEFVESPPPAEVLPYLWEQAELVVAKSISEVAGKLGGVLDMLPSKEGRMVFKHLAQLNKQRPTLGRYAPQIQHERQAQNLVVLDVSGSMTQGTIRRIINDVVALSWKANAHLAIVSSTYTHWEPGTYNVDDVLRKAEFGGTHYEKLAPLMQRNWGTVVTIADYDSSRSAQEYLADQPGRIAKVLDISLVNRPTFLAECLGQLADQVETLLIGSTHNVLA